MTALIKLAALLMQVEACAKIVTRIRDMWTKRKTRKTRGTK